MKNLSNIIISIPVNTQSSAGCDSLIELWWIFLMVWFILINIPCIIYTYWKYIKKKREYPSLGFSHYDIPSLMMSNFGAFIVTTTVILMCQIVFWLYNFIY